MPAKREDSAKYPSSSATIGFEDKRCLGGGVANNAMTSLERDLDRKTREEFNRFQAGCVEEKNAIELVNNAHLSAGESELRLVA